MRLDKAIKSIQEIKMSSNKRTIINVASSIAVLITHALISFVLSPYIVENIGVEANGFVTLANNCITYANLIVAALNSMASRFIMLEYLHKDYKKANIYYNSVFWGNLIIVAVLLLPSAYMIAKLQNFFDIPQDILTDVKLLFGFVFFNFFLTTGFPNWDCGVQVTNRLERQYIPSMCTSLLRCAILFMMLMFFAPHVWYVGMATTVITIITLAINGYNTATLTPELKIRFENGKPICSKHAIWTLVGTGLWNSISSFGLILLNGMDLIIANKALDATAMGIVSLAKTLPYTLGQLLSSIQCALLSEMIINYADGDREAMLKNIKRIMKLTSVIASIPITCVIILGDRFFSLWVPTQDAHLLQTLSVLATVEYIFTGGIVVLYNVFTAVNKVRQNAIAVLLGGAASVGVTLLIAKYTDYGIYAIAGVSMVMNLIRDMGFTLPASAKYLGFKWYQFYPQVGITVLSSTVLIASGFAIKPILPDGSWLALFVSACIIGIIGLTVNLFIVLNRGERRYLINIAKKKFHAGGAK